MDLGLIEKALPLLWQGAEVTLIISAFGILVGLPLGVALALARLSSIRWVVVVSSIYSAVFRGTPLLVQIFILYYGLAQISAIRHSPIAWWLIGDGLHCAVLAVVLNTIAYTSEIFRGGFLMVPKGMIEAAKASGMSPWVTMHRIHFPLALRQALPAYGNEIAILVKESSLASTITVLEVTGHAKRLMSETFAIMEVFALASLFYLAINLIALSLVSWLEKYLSTPRRKKW